MSQIQKDRIDFFFKAIMMGTMSILSFFAVRTMNTMDKATDDIQFLKTSQAVMQNDLTNFKESWKSFVNVENERQKQHDQERKEDKK